MRLRAQDYLCELGVNKIELMPVKEYPETTAGEPALLSLRDLTSYGTNGRLKEAD